MSTSAAEAGQQDAGRFGYETANQIITAQANAGMDPCAMVPGHDDITAWLHSEADHAPTEAGRQAGHAFATEYGVTGDNLLNDLRQPEILPAGTPHPDPDLAARGWEAAGPGIFRRNDDAALSGQELHRELT